ncbi:hypothetical protein TNCV_1747111 [Trichonephila clavipes]|nr:hypothetical protein TNCV_1747111 [Trichonephila clavipes]
MTRRALRPIHMKYVEDQTSSRWFGAEEENGWLPVGNKIPFTELTLIVYSSRSGRTLKQREGVVDGLRNCEYQSSNENDYSPGTPFSLQTSTLHQWEDFEHQQIKHVSAPLHDRS